jgi:hypothetical protein
VLRESALAGDQAQIDGGRIAPAQIGLGASDIIPSERNRVELLGKLNLEHGEPFAQEGVLGSREIEFPDPAKTLPAAGPNLGMLRRKPFCRGLVFL